MSALRNPYTAMEDYAWWLCNTQGTRMPPVVCIKDTTKKRGAYHYKDGCCGAFNDVQLNAPLIRVRHPCAQCYQSRPLPVPIDPPARNSPQGLLLGANASVTGSVLSAEDRAALGPSADLVESLIQQFDEFSVANETIHKLYTDDHKQEVAKIGESLANT